MYEFFFEIAICTFINISFMDTSSIANGLGWVTSLFAVASIAFALFFLIDMLYRGKQGGKPAEYEMAKLDTCRTVNTERTDVNKSNAEDEDKGSADSDKVVDMSVGDLPGDRSLQLATKKNP